MTASLSLAPSLFNPCVAFDFRRYPKIIGIIMCKLWIRREETHALHCKDAEDGISAFMSSLTWRIASSFFRDTPK